MHGLIFVTWEKYIAERFGSTLLYTYRSAIGESAITGPLASRVYDDATLITGVQALCKLTGIAANTVLREYGRYFIINGLTSHLCAYLLAHVHSGRDLLLIMRDAHAQMRRTPDGLTPPLFGYEAVPSNPQDIILIYDSPRKLCSILLGAIEGAAERHGEQVRVIERTCMKYGAPTCRFEVHFKIGVSRPPISEENGEQLQLQKEKQLLADLVLSLLPKQEGITLAELQQRLHNAIVPVEHTRPRVIFEALCHLQYAGLVASTANQPRDVLAQRRYWQAPTEEDTLQQEPETLKQVLKQEQKQYTGPIARVKLRVSQKKS